MKQKHNSHDGANIRYFQGAVSVTFSSSLLKLPKYLKYRGRKHPEVVGGTPLCGLGRYVRPQPFKS